MNNNPISSGSSSSIQITEIELLYEIYFLLKGLPSSLVENVEGSLQFLSSKNVYLPHLAQGTFIAILKPILLRAEKFIALREFCSETSVFFPNWKTKNSASLEKHCSLPTTTPSFIATSFAWALSIYLKEYDQHLDDLFSNHLYPSSAFSSTTHSSTKVFNSTSKPTSSLEELGGSSGSIRKWTLLRILPMFRNAFLEQFTFPSSSLPVLDYYYQSILIHTDYVRFFLLASSSLFQHLEVYINLGDCTYDFFIQPFQLNPTSTSATWQIHQLVASIPCFLQPHVSTILSLGQSAAYLRHSSANQHSLSFLSASTPFHFHSFFQSLVCQQLHLPSSFPLHPLPSSSTSLSTIPPIDFHFELQKALTQSLAACPSAIHWVSYIQSNCALIPLLRILGHLYLFQIDVTNFCDPLFEWIHIEKKEWKDREFLTSLCMEWFQFACSLDSTWISKFEFHLSKASGFDALRISVQLDWPLTAILVPSQFTDYNRWMSTLLYLKQAQYVLLRKTWNRKVRTRSYYVLRHRLIQFVNAMSYFWLTTVIAAQRREFLDSIQTAKHFEHLIELHAQFLQRLLQLGLFEVSPIYKAILSIFHYSVEFSYLSPLDTDSIGKLTDQVTKVIAFIVKALTAISATTSHVNTLIYSITNE